MRRPLFIRLPRRSLPGNFPGQKTSVGILFLGFLWECFWQDSPAGCLTGLVECRQADNPGAGKKKAALRAAFFLPAPD